MSRKPQARNEKRPRKLQRSLMCVTIRYNALNEITVEDTYAAL